MSDWSGAKHALKGLEVLVEGLAVLDKIVLPTGDDKAQSALAGVRAVLQVLRGGMGGQTSPEVVLAMLESMHEEHMAQRREADEALRKKFETP